LGGEYSIGCFNEEPKILPCLPFDQILIDSQNFLNLFSQKIPLLKTPFIRRSFDMNENPAIFLVTISFVERAIFIAGELG